MLKIAEKKFFRERSIPKRMVNETKVHGSEKKAKTPPLG
jgi:hypothetical protein